MKYKVYGNYVFSKFLGEVEASSQEEAIEKALDDAPENAWLCVQCAGEFEDAGELDEISIVAVEIRLQSSRFLCNTVKSNTINVRKKIGLTGLFFLHVFFHIIREIERSK